MSLPDELATLDASAQADLVRRRLVEPIELVDAAIVRIERLNRALNAVITPLFEQARAPSQRDWPAGDVGSVVLEC
jgi:amidase